MENKEDNNKNINLLINNKEINKIFKQILQKIENQKKYKQESVEMMKELQTSLKDLLEKSKENNSKTDND